MNDFHFLRPEMLYLLIPCLILVLLLLRVKRQTDIWQKICSKDLLPYILARQGKRSFMPALLLSSTLALLIMAVAGPTWQMNTQPVIKSQSGLVIALDLSPLMDAEDIKPSRLQRALYKINDLLNLRKEGQTALIVFSGEPFVVTPLTDDTATITTLLPVLETKIMPTAGHQVDKAIAKGAELLEQAGIRNGSVLLVTPEISKTEMEKAIEVAAQKGITISILGVGTEEGTPITKQGEGFVKDDKGGLIITKLSKGNLKQLAKSTNGSYATMSLDDSDIQDLQYAFTHRNPSLEQTELTHTMWHDQGYWLVLAALPLASLIFRRGMFAAIVFFMPYSLQAYSWEDLWKTPDQQAEELFHKEEYQQAKELFQTPDWRAAANYKLGEFEAAAELYQDNVTADGYYNLGTAKAKQGDFAGALQAYEKTLEMQPEHEDALYNKKIIEEMQKQQQQQKNTSKDDKNQQKEQNQNQENKQNQNQDKDQESNQDNSQDKDQDGKQDHKDQQGDQEQSQDKNSDQDQEKQSQQGQQDKEQESEQKSDPSQEMDDQEKEKLQKEYRDQVEKELKDQTEKKAEQQSAAQEELSEEDQQRQIDDRWLQKIKDDPGGLLRRKFLQQYQQQKQTKQLNGGGR